VADLPPAGTTSKGETEMSNLKDQAEDKVDQAAEAIKKTTGKVIDKSKDLAHGAGKAVEKGGKHLQKV
jgi:uncharacterized protein YjbJ (UPF0337 family)